MRHTQAMIEARNSIGGAILGWICIGFFTLCAYLWVRLMLDITGLVRL